MCGFAGAIEFNKQADDWRNQLISMASMLEHRGPDSEGIWFDESVGVGLAHRRLAIIDTSDKGHQPMISHSGRFVIAYNGEIYNFEILRKSLPNNNRVWRGHSDTEIILEAFEEWGVERSVEKFIGMFAFALWDRKEQALYLYRDRLGIKPLYFTRINNSLIFGSELKALKTHPLFPNEIDRDVLELYFRFSYIPDPYCIYTDVYKLKPAHYIKINVEEFQDSSSMTVPHAYWVAKEKTANGQKNLFDGTENEATELLNDLLRDAVEARMISDVPLGAFLSGGLDSSTVVSMMQALSSRPVKTFSIGFGEEEFNEAVQAKKIAGHLKTDHTELYVTPDVAMSVIPRLADIYDEPFADFSQIPTFLISELTRKSVIVSLSGDGGDEIFGGYKLYQAGKDFWKKVGRMPGWLQSSMANVINKTNVKTWDKYLNKFSSLSSEYGSAGGIGDKARKFADLLPSQTPEQLYLKLLSHWKDKDKLVIDGNAPVTVHSDESEWPAYKDISLRMMYFDLISYLPGDILTKLDRASMAVSLEARVPILDHRVVEFAWSLPLSMKVKKGTTKWLLRQVLNKYVPAQLMDYTKKGFTVPIDGWLRTDLKPWAEELLIETRIKEAGYLNYDSINQKWQEHLSGERNWQFHLWSVLMFQAWLEKNWN
ncbi:MAG: asparagine synthase (glutamine-hydrolyzing) [Ignavibacterium sp.]|nr:MAG: asparagine synthase (glutamine-hydrolyzing) [Ignavibacterium sp.]